MSCQRTSKTLLNQSAATTTDWFGLEFKFLENYQRVFLVDNPGSDTLTLEFRVKEENGTNELTHEVDVSAGGKFSTDDPFTDVRVIKAGTAGTANIIGVI